jgi:DNA-binding CsgD family transcriptional regulator
LKLVEREFRKFVGRLLGVLRRVDRLNRPGPRTIAHVDFDGVSFELVVLRSPCEDLASLTPGERRVAVRVGYGLGNSGIGRELGSSSNTVANHLKSIFRKLRVNSRAELCRKHWPNRLHAGLRDGQSLRLACSAATTRLSE